MPCPPRVRDRATAPDPWRATRSATSPTSDVATGRPVASASSPTVGPVSKAEVMTSASLARMRSASRSRDTTPRNRVASSAPAAESSARIGSARAPSPATRSRSSGSSARSAATARANRRGSFCPSRRAANRRTRASDRSPSSSRSAAAALCHVRRAGMEDGGVGPVGQEGEPIGEVREPRPVVLGGPPVDDVDARHAGEGPTLRRRQRRAERAPPALAAGRGQVVDREVDHPPHGTVATREREVGARTMEGGDPAPRREFAPMRQQRGREAQCQRDPAASAPRHAADREELHRSPLEGDLAPFAQGSGLGQAQEAQLEVVRCELHEAAHEGRDPAQPHLLGVGGQDGEDSYRSCGGTRVLAPAHSVVDALRRHATEATMPTTRYTRYTRGGE